MSAFNSSAPPSKYVTLVSSEGFEFVVLRQATYCSPTIKKMLDPNHQWAEAKAGRCVFPEIRYAFSAPPSFLLSFCLARFEDGKHKLAAFFLKDR